ncbi:MAG: hypothetical protein JNL18_03765 [Planctomycetaceae bacterium]|uniref:Uncharacterized protein n=1 Tax=Lacipirellula limnantheis TaxID=2528024 RepID=A0A517U256_9BACT|nr:hypothetical protein [Lacipirellula limnantheis]MBL9161840.1 hypothetical protein [Planctomycetaceae bacterium]QDT74702.1 hypothetical protein I41_39010 [Lacipirellula limnantheis]
MNALTLGGLLAVAFMFPLAGLTALLYQFPVPIAGMVTGWQGVLPAMLGLPIYAALGWVLIPIALGVLSGAAARRLAGADGRRARRITIALAAMSAFACTTTLATIDKLIGPW